MINEMLSVLSTVYTFFSSPLSPPPKQFLWTFQSNSNLHFSRTSSNIIVFQRFFNTYLLCSVRNATGKGVIPYRSMDSLSSVTSLTPAIELINQ